MLTYDEMVVAHLMGAMEGVREISTKLEGYEARAIIVNEIVKEWLDVQGFVEDCCIEKYALRRLHDKFD